MALALVTEDRQEDNLNVSQKNGKAPSTASGKSTISTVSPVRCHGIDQRVLFLKKIPPSLGWVLREAAQIRRSQQRLQTTVTGVDLSILEGGGVEKGCLLIPQSADAAAPQTVLVIWDLGIVQCVAAAPFAGTPPRPVAKDAIAGSEAISRPAPSSSAGTAPIERCCSGSGALGLFSRGSHFSP